MATDPAFPYNVRDVGAAPLTGGGRVRSGLLFRGDDPGRGDRASGDHLTSEFGIRHVLDLRGPEETDRAGLGTFVVRDDVVRHSLALTMQPAVGAEGLPRDAVDLGRLYARSVVLSAAVYVEALRIVADLDGPMLVHCNHGKDRTGVVIALLLSAIGVEPTAIVADFARTADNLPAMHRASRELGISIGLSRIEGVMLEAPAQAMETFLTVMQQRHGGVLAPLVEAGLDLASVERLRERLVEPSML